jgi:hypothetical protein
MLHAAASLGDAAAQKNLDEVLQDDIRAVRDLENLRLGLPAAEAKLREAENAHRLIEAEIHKIRVNELVFDRIDAAKEVDRVLADAGAALQRYLDFGEDIWPLVAKGETMAELAEVYAVSEPTIWRISQALSRSPQACEEEMSRRISDIDRRVMRICL